MTPKSFNSSRESREACPRDRLCAFFHRRAERRRPPPDGAVGNAGQMVGTRLFQWELPSGKLT